MPTFLTVREAAARTGKSPSSIRRLLYKILQTPNHPDRAHVEPDPETVTALRLKGENFPWKLSDDLIRRAVPDVEAEPADAPPAPKADPDAGSGTMIEVLRDELAIKNRQIADMSELLKALGERLREGNILIGSLQRQQALGDPNRQSPSDVPAAEPPPEKGTGMPAGPPRKRGLFRRLFS